MDIRKFFSPLSKGKNQKTKEESKKTGSKCDKTGEDQKIPHFTSKGRKKACLLIDSDSDDDPIPSKLKRNNDGKKNTSETKISPKDASAKKLTAPDDFFGSKPIKRSLCMSSTTSKRKLDPEDSSAHNDDKFKETLRVEGERDPSFKRTKTESLNIKEQSNKISPVKPAVNSSEAKPLNDKKVKETPVKASKISVVSPVRQLNVNGSKKSPPTEKNKGKVELIKPSNVKEKQITPVKVAEKSPNDKNKKMPDEEKNHNHGALYRSYLNREGPKALGSKEIPQGTNGCLNGLKFVITGVLESLEREEASNIIKQYGGKVVQSVSKNINYMIVGAEAGPSKIEKADKLGLKQINEDEFLDLIRASNKGHEEKVPPSNEDKTRNKLNKEKKSTNSKDAVSKTEKSKEKLENNKSSDVSSAYFKDNYTVPEHENLPEKDSSNSPKTTVTQDHLLWVDRYKPVSTSQIIGQQGNNSNVHKLLCWLKDWHKNNASGSNSKKPIAAGKWKMNDSSKFKAALLSGGPGIGKTTSAQLACKEAGFDFIELNASDTRSKNSLKNIVSEMISNRSLSSKTSGSLSKNCLIMDEVDGMSGNQDRGGVQELIQLIKTTKIPIICLCNDRNHPKIRSLSNYCFDLRFYKPRTEQIKGAMMSICFKEHLKVPPTTLEEIIVSTNNDIRQIIHHLSMLSAKQNTSSPGNTTKGQKLPQKDTRLGPFDVVKKVFNAADHQGMSIMDKSDLFFYDYSIGPLFVQENYISIKPHAAQGNLRKHLKLLSLTADSIAYGDIVDRTIRSEGSWSLLPVQAIFGSVIPGNFMEGNFNQMINFPSWLGRNSSRNKFDRMLQELHMHMRLSLSGNKTEVNSDYLSHLCDAITKPVVEKENEGVREAINVMASYYLLREDLDNIIEMTQWSNKDHPFTKLNPKVKAAFTREFNKDTHLNPYATVKISKPKKETLETNIEGGEEETMESEEEQQDDDILKDAMIKAKKKPPAKEKSKPVKKSKS